MCAFKFKSKTTSFSEVSITEKLPIYSIREKGDIRSKRSGKKFTEYSLSLNATDADWDDFPKQVSDVIQFIEEHKDTLMILSNLDDVYGYLDFPLWSRLHDEMVMQSDFFTPKLISLAGEIGLDIGFSIYARDAFDDLD